MNCNSERILKWIKFLKVEDSLQLVGAKWRSRFNGAAVGASILKGIFNVRVSAVFGR